ncbi:MAG: hypothetical protein WAL67_05610 [Candidatus Cybelea sp.]
MASIYVLRRTLPDAVRLYRAWGYPVVPALFLVASAYLMINTFISTPGRALAGLGIVALGLTDLRILRLAIALQSTGGFSLKTWPHGPCETGVPRVKTS